MHVQEGKKKGGRTGARCMAKVQGEKLVLVQGTKWGKVRDKEE